MGLHAVIMAGGSGTRFWPLSRAARPKQFLPLTGKQPLIAATASRVRGLVPPARVSVVCGAAHVRQVRAALPSLPPRNVLVEPQARNTAPAIALACAHVAHKDPQGVLVVLPADQHVARIGAFRAALKEAVRVAKTGQIVTLGIAPTRPETGYGYVRAGKVLSGEARRVAAFVEKPDLTTAQRYLHSGEYLWNAGIFVFRVDVMLAALAEHLPLSAEPLASIRAAWGTKRRQATLKREFQKMPATSIDYAVAEKAKNIAVVPADCGWSDVGSFSALREVRPLDAEGNVTKGEALLVDTSNSVVLAGRRPVAVVGLSGVVVVDAGDAVLVLNSARSQDVRRVVDALKVRRPGLL